MEFQDGAAGELEGLFAAVPDDLSHRAVSRDVGEREGSFNQINKNTSHRIKYAKVDADTGEEVANQDIIKGYKIDTYVTVDKDELDNIALESTRAIDIDEFVPKSEIDELYLARPY